VTVERSRRLLNGYTIGRTGSAANAWALARATYPSVPRLEITDGPAPFELHQRLVALDDVKLMALTTTGHRIDLEDHGHLNVVLPRSGRLTVDDGRRVATAAPGAVLVPGLGRRDSRCGPDYEGLYVMVRRSALEARFEVEGARARTAWADGLGRVGRSMPAATSLGDLVDVLVRDIERHGLLARFERPRRNAAALLMDAVVALHLSCGEASGRLAPPASAGAWHVARAEAFIVANAGEPLSIADVAAAAGTGTRSLQLAFKRHRGSTPRAFLQACRLERLYRRLWAAEPGTRVVDVALESGITHLGRAAAAYRRRFGETPSQTLAQALRHR
jgi:AraC-like DNA-binding protein